MAGMTRAMNEAKGMPPAVVDRLTRAIMASDPELALGNLDEQQ
jgi:hypothetical protein